MKNFALTVLATAALCISTSLFALTPPGTIVTNDATVTYADDAGAPYAGSSNSVSFTVAARTVVTKLNVYADPSQPTVPVVDAPELPVAPGDTVYVPISYTNGGDAPDKYSIAAYGVIPTDYKVSFIGDDNSDGSHQPTETTDLSQTPWIAANATEAKSFIAITAPGTATLGATVSIGVKAVSFIDPTGPLGVGYDEATLKLFPTLFPIGPRLIITAVSDKVMALPGEMYTITYTVTNDGTDVAQSVSLFAVVPENAVVESSNPAGALQEDGTAYIVPLPQIAAGETTTVTVTYKVL